MNKDFNEVVEMNKNKKIFTIIEIFITILAFLAFSMTGSYFATNFIECYPNATDADFILNMVLLFAAFGVIFLITIILHELGHMVYGLKAGLDFEEFSVANLSIKKINGKLKIVMKNTISGIGGYCRMKLAREKSYNNKFLLMYFLGGVIVNYISTIVWIVIFLLTMNHPWLSSVALMGIVTNLYLGLLNSLPQTSTIGMEYDMLKVSHFREDNDYLIKAFTASSISDDLLKGVPIETIEAECPSSFKFDGDVLLGLTYADILMRKNKYIETKDLLIKIESETANQLSKQNELLLKIQFIECELRSDCDIESLKKYWTPNVKKYITAMTAMHPSFICFEYAYYLLLQNDEKTANKKRDLFNKNDLLHD